MQAIRIHALGGPEVLQRDDIPSPMPGPGQIRIRVAAAGVNYIDTYKRSGLYPVALPFTLGEEAAGTVTAVGPDVTAFAPGDRVASSSALGGYAEEALLPVAKTVRVPDEVTLDLASAMLLQGLTAHYLVRDTFPLRAGHTAVVHAAAGGVGLLLVQLAARAGARVLATVGSAEKARLAREAGAAEVCLYNQENFAAAARAFSGGAGVDVVYDGVGRTTFEGSLASLRPRGMLVSFGNASGAIPPFAPLLLSQHGSLFLTRPTLAHYIATREELNRRAGELFTGLGEGWLQVRIGGRFPLARAAEAHRALESRTTVGKLLLET